MTKIGLKYFVLWFMLLVVASAWGRKTVTWKHGELVVSDDDFTFAVLDYLITPSLNGEDALNDSVFWEICKLSDGALSEVLGGYVHKGLKTKPGMIERIIGNDSITEIFLYFFTSEYYYEYKPDDKTIKDVNREAEKIFYKMMSDFREFITENEYRYLLQLKPEIKNEMVIIYKVTQNKFGFM